MKATGVLAVSATCLLLASACSPPSGEASGDDASEQAEGITVGLPNDVSGREWDPALTAAGTAVPVLYSIYETLYEFDEEGKPQPHIVESDELSDDELTLTMTIRSGMAFHDGSDLTAEDVAFSLNRARGEDESLEGPTSTSALALIESVQAEDETTVVIQLSEPDPVLRNSLAYLPGMVVPAEYIEEIGNEGFLAEPVGSGPYVLEESTPGQEFTLTAFEDYSLESTPAYDEVNLQVLQEGATRIAQLRAGDIDFAVDVDISQVESLEQDGLNVVTNPSGQYLSIIFNHRNEALEDERVRQAINLAVDQENIIDSLYNGLGTATGTLDASLSPEQVPPFDYDPDRAGELLDEAGYNGETLVLNYPAGRYPQDSQLVQTLQANLADVGVNVEIQSMDSNQWLDGLRENTLDDMSLTLVGNTNYDSYQQLWSATACEGPWSLWCDPELDEQLDELSRLAGEERLEGSIEMSESFKETPPALFLLDFHQIYAMRDGVAWHPTPGIRNFDYTDIRPEG